MNDQINHSIKVIEVDSRRRITLGKLATSNLYSATTESDGTIILTPVIVVPWATIHKVQFEEDVHE